MILPEHGTVPPEKTFDQERNRLNLENNPLKQHLIMKSGRLNIIDQHEVVELFFAFYVALIVLDLLVIVSLRILGGT